MKNKKGLGGGRLVPITSFLICNTFVLSGAIVGFSYSNKNQETIISPVSETVEPIETKESKEVVKLTEQPKTLDDYNKADPKSIATLSKFDSRQYDIITPIKNQGSEGLCWAYATAGTAEASILKEGLTKDKNIRFSPRGIDYITNKRKANFDPLGNNPTDEWGGSQGAGASQMWAMHALQMWTGPLDQNVHGDTYMQTKPDYVLENASVLVVDRNEDVKTKIQKIKEMVAEFGSITIDFDVPRDNPAYVNTNYLEGRWVGHAVDIIGWDDNVPKERYNNGKHPASLNGGWLCKNSWGPTAGLGDGTIFISYDSHIGAMIGLDFDKANNKYDNNYYYDAKSEGDGGVNAEGKKTAAIFKAKRANYNTREILKAVNVGFSGEDTTITAKVYRNVKADFDHPLSSVNDPESGTLATTVTKKVHYQGYTTIELDKEIVLEPGEVFSVVIELSNPNHDAKLYYSNDKSEDNMTFYYDGARSWVNPMKEMLSAAARIKAFTKEEEIPNQTSNSLKDARIEMSSPVTRIGEPEPTVESVTIGNKVLRKEDYDIEMGDIQFTVEPHNIDSVNKIVGYRKIKIKGKNSYEGEQEIKHLYRVGRLPNLENKAWYTNDNDPSYAVINLRVKKSARTYREIGLPPWFQWVGNVGEEINYDNPLTLEFKGENADYYRKHVFYPKYIKLEKMDSDNFKPVPDNVNKPDSNKPSNPIPSPQPPYDDPECNIKYANITLDGYEFVYDGKPVTPKVTKIVTQSGANLSLGTVKVSYEDNDRPGVGKVIVTGDFDKTPYFGTKEIPFTILNKDGSKPDLNKTPEFKSIEIDMNNSNNIIDGDNIFARARVEGSNLSDVKYKWEVVNGYTSLSSTNETVSFVADHRDNGKKLKVTATCGEKSISTEITLNIQNRPTPPPQQSLQTISIDLNKDKYKVGETIYAIARVNPSNLSGLQYSWYLDNIYQGSEPSISFRAEAFHHNKSLELRVTHNSNTLNNNVLLRVEQVTKPDTDETPSPLPPVNDNGPSNGIVPPSNNMPGNTGNSSIGNNTDIVPTNSSSFNWWIYVVIGSGALLVIIGIILAILALKKKKAEQIQKPIVIKQVKTPDVKTIPLKTTTVTTTTTVSNGSAGLRSNQNTNIPTFKNNKI